MAKSICKNDQHERSGIFLITWQECQSLLNNLMNKGGGTWSAVLISASISTLLLKVFLKLLTCSLAKMTASTQSAWDDIGVELLKKLKIPIVFVWFFYFFSKSIEVPAYSERLLLIALVIASIFQMAIWGLFLVSKWKKIYLAERIKLDPSAAPTLNLLYLSVQVAFITIVVLIGLSNLGVNIGALLAGLGVGGIALALAAQNVLGDLLASLSILLDKPFEVGDTIMVEGLTGTVEYIGIKSTRLRSASGEQLIFSNKNLLEKRVHNYKRMWQRRVVHKIGVIYTTTLPALENIPIWIKDIVESCPQVRFERCHLVQYGSSSLDFELIFWINGPSYLDFVDSQQKILLGIYKKFQEEKVEFSYSKQGTCIV